MAHSSFSDVEIVSPDRLDPADIAAWEAMRRDQPAFASPLLGSGFARAVGAVRSDARIAIVRRQGAPIAFFPHHRRPGGFGRPIGAPFADYHAVVSGPDAGLEPGRIIGLAALRAFRHAGLIDPHGLFAGPDQALDGYAIVLDVPADDYLERLRAGNPKRFKNYRRLQNRLAELGPLRMSAEPDPIAFETVIGWKRAQFLRTGVQDVLRPAWAMDLMRNLLGQTEGATRGLLLTLWAGDRLVAGHFGVREGEVYHPWIASNDPEAAAYSPGQTFLSQAIRAMPDLGLSVYDLGVGHDHYKRPFASTVSQVGAGFQTAGGGAGRLSRASEGLWSLGGVRSHPAADRVRRRLDHIAASDPTLGGRIRGLVEAAGATRKRSLTGAAADAD